MKPTALVVTTVHWPDDTRIRERLIRALVGSFHVKYATKRPGPSDVEDIEWVPLDGGRVRRNCAAIRLALIGEWDVLVVHDPELLPAAMLAGVLRRRSVVFDVHENIPAIALTRGWVPSLLRRPLAAALRVVLRLAERVLTITLAEPGYQSLFGREHVVFPNYPETSSYPEPGPGDRRAVYLGDVTDERGAPVAVEGSGLAGVPLVFVGRASEDLRRRLADIATDPEGVIFRGELPNPVALREIAGAGVGLCPLLDRPNYRDSTPTKILEYLAMGIPVVATDLPGTRRLVEGLDAVELVTPGDAQGLGEAIARSLRPEVREIAQTQAADIRSRFRWPAGEVASFYLGLV